MNMCSDVKKKIDIPKQSIKVRKPGEREFQQVDATEIAFGGTSKAVQRINAPMVLIFYDSVMMVKMMTGSKDGGGADRDEDGDCGMAESVNTNTTIDHINQLADRYPHSILCVTNKVDGDYNNLGITQVEDENGVLASEFRALNPIGGGSVPLDCLVFLDNQNLQRAFVPLTKIKKSDFLSIVQSSLEYLMWEQQQQ